MFFVLYILSFPYAKAGRHQFPKKKAEYILESVHLYRSLSL
ncbi:hypothetical protein HMPREF0766_13353 [Sphingobacterium spiritivorum ATCC 33861]|uniref:Uncharacterized protein n=1 Tax=Sphingobacterium spiritivorum ATCC 33861 TaxID=525373 RepID=D7VQU9_SPHSI|nr:hypothetical protein HMPREF0766_13353 [Sphingobacterium spiritivorum ATCC 33861]